MDENGVLSLVPSSSTSAGLANTLWCVTVSSENQGQAPKFDFMNKGTGRMLDITMAEILKSQSQVDLTPTTGGEIAGWAFSRTITKLEDKRPLFSYFTTVSLLPMALKFKNGLLSMFKIILLQHLHCKLLDRFI